MKKSKARRTLWNNFFPTVLTAIFVFGVSVWAYAANKEVHILFLCDLTGPYSQVHPQSLKGAEDFVQWSNKNNKIEGVNLVLDVYDVGTDVSKTVAAFNMGISKKPRPVFTTGGLTTTTALALKPLCQREQIPLLDGTSARPLLRPKGWAVSTNPTYEGQFAGAGKWVIDNWKPDSKVEFIRRKYENRKPRLAIIGWDNAFGRSFDLPEPRSYLEKIGIDFIGAEYIPMVPMDTPAHLLRLKQKGMDFAFMIMYANAGAVVSKDAERLGMSKDFMQLGSQIYSLNDLKKLAGPLSEGTAMLTGYPHDENALPPGIKELFLKRTGVELHSYCVGVTYLSVMSEVIQKAIKRVGVDKLDGKACWESLMNDVKNFQPYGYVTPMTFSSERLTGPDAVNMLVLRNGKIEVLDKNVYCPDLLPGGKDVPK